MFSTILLVTGSSLGVADRVRLHTQKNETHPGMQSETPL
jgi:hypothetical protein